MTICSDSEYVARAFRTSILNRKRNRTRTRNRNDIQIHIRQFCERQLPNFSRGTTTTAQSSKIEHHLHSKYCVVLDLLAIKCSHSYPKRGSRSAQQQYQQIQYFLCKLKQICLIVVLLLPFLITYNTLIQEASGEGLENAVSISKTRYLHPGVRKVTPADRLYQLQNHMLRKRDLEEINSSAIESEKPLFSNNGYSLIVLSRSAYYLFNEQVYNRSSFPKLSVRSKREVIRNRSVKKAEGQKLDNDMHNDINNAKLAKLVVTGLGLKKLPDMKKANISQLEYSSKYIEYLQRLRKNVENKQEANPNRLQASLQLLSIVTNRISEVTRKLWHHKRAIRAARICERSHGGSGYAHRPGTGQSERTNILLHFPLMHNGAQVNYEQIDEANIRLMMLYNPSLSTHDPSSKPFKKKNRISCNNVYEKGLAPPSSKSHAHGRKPQQKSRVQVVNLKIFQLLRKNRRLQLDVRRIEFENSNGEETHSQWLEFDVTEAVRGWLNGTHENLGIEIQCDKCRRYGARILSDASIADTNHDQEQNQNQNRFQLTPVLNIIGHVGRSHSHRIDPETSRANQSNNLFFHRLSLDYPEHSKKWPNSCYRAHQRCCRHQLDVAFKDLKGFEFIIQPKTFDAGFCKGRCPPRHNPAHHHALLQSLMWQQHHDSVPRPCCAPSKLTKLEILHVDEEHSDKLKISTWSDMQVLECACS